MPTARKPVRLRSRASCRSSQRSHICKLRRAALVVGNNLPGWGEKGVLRINIACGSDVHGWVSGRRHEARDEAGRQSAETMRPSPAAVLAANWSDCVENSHIQLATEIVTSDAVELKWPRLYPHTDSPSPAVAWTTATLFQPVYLYRCRLSIQNRQSYLLTYLLGRRQQFVVSGTHSCSWSQAFIGTVSSCCTEDDPILAYYKASLTERWMQTDKAMWLMDHPDICCMHTDTLWW